jgi:hypothetical protein
VRGNNSPTSIQKKEDNWNFTIKDTATITRIEIADKVPSKVVLTREKDGWMVNEKYEARKDAVEILLETMHRMTMRNFVPEPSIPTVAKRLAVYGKEVKVYNGNTLIKHFYVGNETTDQLGTYMMLEGGDAPYAVFIQGFNGYLNSRFFTEEELWRDRTIFGLSVPEIKSIDMNYTGQPESSFRVTNENGDIGLFSSDGKKIENARKINLNLYTGSFRTAKYEAVIVPTDGIWARRDSLLQFAPVFTLTIIDAENKEHIMTAYNKGPDSDQLDEDGNPLIYDPNRLYAFTNDGRWVLIQYYGLRNIIVEREFFTTELITDY